MQSISTKLPKVTPALLQTMTLACLLIATPFAMTFVPYEKIYIQGLWHTQLHSDPLYRVRSAFVIGGMFATLFSVGALIWELIREDNEGKWDLRKLVLSLSMVVCSISIGWRSFPYWVNGVFHAYSSNDFPSEARVFDLDPKGLLPEIWIGDYWSLGVVLITGIAYIGIPILFVLSAVLAYREKTWRRALGTAAILAIAALTYLWAPKYWEWFFD